MERRRRDEGSDDSPTYSRLFVVCDKNINAEALQNAFAKYGTIEDLYLPRDHHSGDLKGIAYVKFSKTSEAAAALEGLNATVLPGYSRPIKVMIACNRSEIQSNDDDEEKYRRIFVAIPKVATEDELQEHFGQFGHVVSVNIHRDHNTGESKGFAYIKFRKFSEAAAAFEKSDRKYRAIFAQPKGHNRRRHETSFETNINNLATSSANMRTSIMSMMSSSSNNNGSTRINYICAPFLHVGLLRKIFDIVPGMVDCQFYVDLLRNCGKGSVTYSNPVSASYALEKFNRFEYPPGSCIFVRPDNSKFNSQEQDSFSKLPDTVNNLKQVISATSNSSSPDLAQLAEAIAEASKLIKAATAGVTDTEVPNSSDLNYCSVKLPPPQPLADIDSNVAKRCFLVCKPQPPPQTVLRDVFCRFGNLINVYTLPNKTVGYARYATTEGADSAIKTLHGAEICGVRMKVLEADDEAPPKRRRYE